MITRNGYTVDVHRMVQAVARYTGIGESTEANLVDAACKQAAGLLVDVLPPPRDQTGWLIWRGLLSHVDASNAHAEPRHRDHVLLSLVNLEAPYLLEHGQVGRAIPLFEQALSESERTAGANHRDTLNSRGNVAHAYLSSADR